MQVSPPSIPSPPWKLLLALLVCEILYICVLVFTSSSLASSTDENGRLEREAFRLSDRDPYPGRCGLRNTRRCVQYF